MQKLTPEDLYATQRYAQLRARLRPRMLAHRQQRRLHLGPCAVLHFEDRVTVQYQIQELLRAERADEPGRIEEQLRTYNPLIPNGSNWKATLMIECAELEAAEATPAGLASRAWVRVQGSARVYAAADEDLEGGEAGAAYVHFLRFELTGRMRAAARGGAALGAGIDHPAYYYSVDPVPEALRRALVEDLA